MTTLEALPPAMLRQINPIEDRIEEFIEKLNKLRRMTRKTHDVKALFQAQTFCSNDLEDMFDLLADTIDAEIKKGTR